MYSSITHNIKVTVTPAYLAEQSDPDEYHFVWSYTIQLENLGQVKAQLINRHWHITDGLGGVQEVRGPGVVGEQPILEPGSKYQYTSGVALKTAGGIMVGTYEMLADGGSTFLIDIPAFSLDSPQVLQRAN